MEDIRVTAPSAGEVCGIESKEQLPVYKINGKKAPITDTCIIAGGIVYEIASFNMSNDSTPFGRTGPYYTRDCSGREIKIIGGPFGIPYPENAYNLDASIRLVLHLPDDMFNDVIKNSYKGNNDVDVVDFGEFPQYAANIILQRKFARDYDPIRREASFETGLIKTPKNARTYNIGIGEYQEIEYYGNRYIYAEVKCNTWRYRPDRWEGFTRKTVIKRKGSAHLTNGHTYKQGDYCLLQIKPVTWLIDYEKRTLISKNCLLSGVHVLEGYESTHGKFDTTAMGRFINEYTIKEILQGTDLKDISREKPIDEANEPIMIVIPYENDIPNLNIKKRKRIYRKILDYISFSRKVAHDNEEILKNLFEMIDRIYDDEAKTYYKRRLDRIRAYYRTNYYELNNRSRAEDVDTEFFVKCDDLFNEIYNYMKETNKSLIKDLEY